MNCAACYIVHLHVYPTIEIVLVPHVSFYPAYLHTKSMHCSQRAIVLNGVSYNYVMTLLAESNDKKYCLIIKEGVFLLSPFSSTR